MNKVSMSASLLAVLGSVGIAQSATTGTINFTGEITSSTCDVSINGGGTNGTVALPTVTRSQLSTTGETAGITSFTVDLNECEGVLKTASVFFESGSSVDPITGRLKNIGGSAQQVSLQLRDLGSAARSVIEAGNQNQVQDTTYLPMDSGSANLPYAVEYYSEGSVSAGTVISNAVYSIQYK